MHLAVLVFNVKVKSHIRPRLASRQTSDYTHRLEPLLAEQPQVDLSNARFEIGRRELLRQRHRYNRSANKSMELDRRCERSEHNECQITNRAASGHKTGTRWHELPHIDEHSCTRMDAEIH